ncbi:MAG: hypothetical protein KF868_15760 [Acidobacteria bacterium]|nr:hypothetical protein [Acidobacteriota bacterium]MCW5967508.1 hypothetical protein [Blastocatellales bacterium]
MFDKLVESGIRARTARGWIYFASTSVIYCIALLTATVAAVVWFNPGLAEER